MNKKIFFNMLLILFLCLVVLSNIGFATSLLNDTTSLYADKKANQVGDLLTIIIQESATASQQASTDASQSSQASVGAGTGILDFIRAFGMNQSDNSSATGGTSRSGTLVTDITVKITEILPSGNFKIKGHKNIIINDEKQKIDLTGIVRPKDITPENTIDSTYIADVKIDYHGRGVIGDKQKPGIISRILDWFF